MSQPADLTDAQKAAIKGLFKEALGEWREEETSRRTKEAEDALKANPPTKSFMQQLFGN